MRALAKGGRLMTFSCSTHFRADDFVRAVRFAARFRFIIEPATIVAIRRHAAEIGQVSAERLRDELTKLLTEGAARRGFELLDDAGLLQQLLPEIAAMKSVEQPPEFHPEGDVWIHTLLMIEQLPAGCSPTLAWGVLLHDVGKGMPVENHVAGSLEALESAAERNVP